MEVVRLPKDGSEITFLDGVFWPAGESKIVEFYDGTAVMVSVVNADDPGICDRLAEFADTTPMSVDFEWKPDRKYARNPISVFQFASTRGVYIVLNQEPNGTEDLRQFLNDHHFFGKGMSCDRSKLQLMFSTTFNIEDIQETRVLPNRLPVNFTELVDELIGPPVVSFKDKQISMSDWSQRPLTVRQVLYAAFDAYATFRIYNEIRKVFGGPEIMASSQEVKKPRIPGQKKSEAKSGDGRKRPQMSKQIKPKFDLNVDFVPKIEPPPEEDREFVQREVYNCRVSLLEYLKTYNEIQISENGWFCRLCDKLIDDPLNQSWSEHFSSIGGVYFPDQSPSYHEECLRQVHIANTKAICNRESLPKVTCSECSRVFPTFHCFYRHCRLMHNVEFADDGLVTDPRDLLLEHMRMTFEASELKCCVCDLEFADENALKVHCWMCHGDFLASMLKHRPASYSEETFSESMRFGELCLRKGIAAVVWHGSICCGICKIGFDDPGELFVHLFHRHSRIRVVRADEIGKWPLALKSLPKEFIGVVKRVLGNRIIDCLVGSKIYEAACVKCGDCQFGLGDPQRGWDHALQLHVVVLL
jgi:hypothetical protein